MQRKPATSTSEVCVLTFAWGVYSGFYTLTSKHQFVDRQGIRVPSCGLRWFSFATAQSFREGCQAYKNEVYLLPTLIEASQRTHREHSPNDVVVKVLVRSCRVYHQKSAEHQFVDRQ